MLSEQLLSLQKSRFTGKLEIKYSPQSAWKIYFCLGRVIWADGGEHPNRFWMNNLNKYCDRPDFNKKNIAAAKKFECWNYRLLTILLEQEKLGKAQLKELINKQNNDIFFDIIQAEASQTLEYIPKEACGEFLLSCGLKMSSTILNADKKLSSCQKEWEEWCNKGLKEISPNLAPKIEKLGELKEKVSTPVYENFVKIIDGEKTLRELATQLDRDLIKLTSSLLPYINEGLIELNKVEDREYLKITTERDKKIKTDNKPLVACIDDSSQIIFLMEKIISDRGYNFLGIKDPIKAIPKLISAKPDLIFLDIGMPAINGYEICAQLKKISKLKNTPVVMLTGQDGMVDKVRAKVVGASQFISKPINVEIIKQIMTKLLVTEKLKKQAEQEKKKGLVRKGINPALASR